MKNEVYLLIDGSCGFCRKWANFIDKKMKQSAVTIMARSSAEGLLLQQKLNINNNIDSVILIEHGIAHYHSNAALRLCLYLRGFWPLLYVFIIIPASLRNFVYRKIAAIRYRFGKDEFCNIP